MPDPAWFLRILIALLCLLGLGYPLGLYLLALWVLWIVTFAWIFG